MNLSTTVGSQKHFEWRWIYPVLLVASVFVASGRSHVATPDIINIDKLAHFGVFGSIATGIVRLVPRWKGFWVVVLVSLYGISDEWRQSFTAGRSVEVADWIADTLGAAMAVSAYRLWPAYRKLLETRLPSPKWRLRRKKIAAAADVSPS